MKKEQMHFGNMLKEKPIQTTGYTVKASPKLGNCFLKLLLTSTSVKTQQM